MCMHAHVCGCGCTPVCAGQRITGVLYLKNILIFCRDKVSHSPQTSPWRRFQRSVYPSPCSLLPGMWMQNSTLRCSCGLGKMNLDAHVCIVNWLRCLFHLVNFVFLLSFAKLHIVCTTTNIIGRSNVSTLLPGVFFWKFVVSNFLFGLCTYLKFILCMVLDLFLNSLHVNIQ